MKVILKGEVAEGLMSEQTQAWIWGIVREFNRAGATAAHAALAAAVVVDGMNMWERIYQMGEFALAAFVVKGVTGALEFVAKDPTPLVDTTTVSTTQTATVSTVTESKPQEPKL